MNLPSCDICGSDEQLYRTVIEGSELSVCRACSKFGKVITPIKQKPGPKEILKKEKEIIKQHTGPEREVIQVIVEDYAEIVRKAREKLGMKQEEFAKRINEKESIIHKIETGLFEPNVDLARKLERALKIKIIEQHEEVKGKPEKTKPDAFTIGDFIKIKEK